MKRVLEGNPNTIEYWEKVYEGEAGTGKVRVDDERFGALMRWVGLRGSEIGRRPSLLDAGCGLADVLRKAKEKGLSDRFSYTGIDISPSTISKVRTELEADGIRFQVSNAADTPFRDEEFDVSWCGETLEHLENPDQAIRELARVTGEGGFVVLSTPYKKRNTSPEHVWEFEPWDVVRWGAIVGELLYLDTFLLPGWLTMVSVFRRIRRSHFT